MLGEATARAMDTVAALGERMSVRLVTRALVSAHTNRVAVNDGHILCLWVELSKKAELSEVFRALSGYEAPPESCDLPSARWPVIVMKEAADRPQPRQDRMAGKGMTTVVGRLRSRPAF